MSLGAYGQGDYGDALYGINQFVTSSAFSYGTGLYGANSYGEDNLPSVISATATISATASKVVYPTLTISSVSVFTALGGFTANISATLDASATSSSDSVRVREGSATVSVSSSITVTPTCTFSVPIRIDGYGQSTYGTADYGVDNKASEYKLGAASSGSCLGEVFILELSDKFDYGTGLYGLNQYDQADLQTIVSATSVATTATAEKINLGSAVSSGSSASTTATAEKIHQQGGSTTCSSDASATGVMALSSGALAVSSSADIVIVFERKRNAEAIVSTTSGTLAIAREKWEVIAPTSTTWTDIAA